MNHLLSYQEFSVCIKEHLKTYTSPDMEVTYGSRNRRGGKPKDTIEFKRKGEDFGRIFYIEDMYREYLQGAGPELIAKGVAQMCTGDMPESMRGLFQYEQVKDRLTLRLVNYEKNREMLEDLIYRRFLDLALVCRVICPSDDGEIHTTIVTGSLLSRWGVTEDEVFAQAEKCVRKSEPAILRPLRDLLTELDPDGIGPNRESDLYVLTSKNGIAGASALLTSDYVRSLAQKLERDILVLPSSIHEVLLLPDWGEWEVGSLRKIVKDINHTVVPEEDYLSDNVYRYRLAEHEFVLEQ